VLSEAEFLARREAVERVMAVRQVGERTQIAVLEDDVLVEHYVTKASNTSYAGNVYLGKVQNVLPSMEAAFVDIGKGRNAVLYAGEVNWDAAGMDGKPRKIELAMKSGDPVLVQVTKDPIGHKGARLTSQISLPGRFLVYVPEGQMTGISRKLPDTERKRLKDILKRIIPENAGVIIRTAAEGASEEELTRDVARLEAQWQTIKAKAEKGQAPSLLYGEPDLVIRVIRDIFNEDFAKLVVSGDEAWEIVQQYVEHVSPDLVERLSKHAAETDLFASLRVDEQLAKALDRKVWLPSGGSLVIDRTEAMTVVDVNTGKFVGQGGNLEETVTRNNLEAAEEIVRQLRLRDVGGIIVIDFIDMVLEGNRDLVLRRLTECLGRDRTKHQVAEVTSLGLVQMTRKRVGQGLLEAFSDTCEHCKGRGVMVYSEPIDRSRQQIPRPTPKPAPPAPSVPGAGRPESVATEVAELAESGVAEVEEPAEGRSRRRRGRGRGAVSTEGAVSAAGIVSAEGAALAESPAPAQGAFSNGDGVLGESGVPAPNVRTGKTGFGEDDEVPAPSTADHAGSSVVESFAEQAGLLAPEPLEIEAPARQRRRAASRPAGPPVTVG
jgi:ribonuclease E